MVGYMGLMHDCGKIAIPDGILNKKGPLTDEEREIIKQHTVKGGQMLENFTSLPGIRDGALYHHERYDGKGYPQGLIGKEIPLYARIINELRPCIQKPSAEGQDPIRASYQRRHPVRSGNRGIHDRHVSGRQDLRIYPFGRTNG